MNTHRGLFHLLLVVLFCTTVLEQAHSQHEGSEMAFGFNAGGSKYWGEFSDNQFWYGGDIFLRYNIVSAVSVHFVAGLTQLRYKITESDLRNYSDYFGINAKVGDMYPNLATVIEEKNAIRLNTYEVFLSLNILPKEKFIPYIFGGIGYMNWNPATIYSNAALPNNAMGKYDKMKMEFPVGAGFEAYLSENVVLNGRGTFRITGTDYIDDYTTTGSANDAFITFGMGLSYYVFRNNDWDSDGLTNSEEERFSTDPHNPDSDGDGISDGDEVKKYHTDPLKNDSDGDGLGDYDEIFKLHTDPVRADTDNDGLADGEEITRKTDPLKADTDNDGLTDGDEVKQYRTDPLKTDTDGDGLSDGDEIKVHNTNPLSRDSDSDGLSDGDEVLKYKTNPSKADTDGDGLNDGDEINVYHTDPLRIDTDSDGLNDGDEVKLYHTDPANKDTDSDGLTDSDEVLKYKTNPLKTDTDGDGLNDGDEVNVHHTDPLKTDTDSDGLSDGDEVKLHHTDPNNKDTDGEGLTDGDEVIKYKTNPLKTDTDSDGLSDSDEINRTHTDPLNPDTDGDTILDGEDACPLIKGVRSTIKERNGCPEEVKVGTKTDFPDILFIVNTDQFNFSEPSTGQNLIKLLAYVNQCANLRVIIEGHASEEGSAKRNMVLSDMRAKKVKEWLVEQGVTPAKFEGTIGYGSSKPKIPEPKGTELKRMSRADLEAIRKQNRRITVIVQHGCD